MMPSASSPMVRITDWSVPFIAIMQRCLRLQAEAGILLDEAGGIGAGLHREDRIDLELGELAEIGAEVGGVERMPELLHDLAAALGEHLGRGRRTARGRRCSPG